MDVMYKLLGGRARTAALDVDFVKYLNVRPKAAIHTTSEKHVLLDYTIEKWPWQADAGWWDDFWGRKTTFLSIWCAIKSFLSNFALGVPIDTFGRTGVKSCWTEEDGLIKPKDIFLTCMMHWAAEYGLIVFFKQTQRSGSSILGKTHFSIYMVRYSTEPSFT